MNSTHIQEPLSSTRPWPVNVSLATAALLTRGYDAATRAAALWLANLSANAQRIQLCWQRRLMPDPLGTVGRITEVDLGKRLGLDHLEIYWALTGNPRANLPAFRQAVEKLRGEIEAAIPPLVETEDTATIATAYAVAGDEHEIVTLEAKWRHGKTTTCERPWLLSLHRTIFIDCPSDSSEQTFVCEVARALGIGIGGVIKLPKLKEQIKCALGIGLIDRIVIDDAQHLWPENLTEGKPKRLEFVRHLRDSLGVGFLLITTDQFALALETAKQNNSRWAPGQLSGRRYQFKLRDKHSEEEVRAIATLHACGADGKLGTVEPEALDLFSVFAEAEEGYLGVMVNAIKAARREAGPGKRITARHASAATIKQGTDERLVKLVSARKKRSRRLQVVRKEAA